MWRSVVLIVVVHFMWFVRGQTEFQDVAIIRIMTHVIGNGAMNMDHYLNSLGIACERKNVGLWRVIEEDFRKCSKMRTSREGHYASLPRGSFEKMCRKIKTTETCNRNLARDLDECLGKRMGSDALAFMDAYVDFSCKDIRDTENQLVAHSSGHNAISPGVFKCFPELQDRILMCVKKDTFSNNQCSQFYTVQTCFAQFYSSYKNCNDIGVVGYLRDLFRSMSNELNCPEPNAWDNAISSAQQQSRDPRPFQIHNQILLHKPVYPDYENGNSFPKGQSSSSPKFQNNAERGLPSSPNSQNNPGNFPSSPKQPQSIVGKPFPLSSPFNNNGNFPSSPSKFQNNGGNFPSSASFQNNAGNNFPSSPQQFQSNAGNSHSQESHNFSSSSNGGNSFPSSPQNIKPVNAISISPPVQSPLWRPLLVPVTCNTPYIPQSHPQSAPVQVIQPHDQNKKELERSSRLENPPSPILGSWFNLAQRSDKSPGWTLPYEGYGNNDKQRFYSFRRDPMSAEVDQGVYDIYRIHSDKYGFPQRSKGLSNRVKIETSTSKARKAWDDNHFRKFKNEQEFQTTPRISTYDVRYIPFKRKVPTIQEIDKNSFDNVNEEAEDEALIQSVYSIEPSRRPKINKIPTPKTTPAPETSTIRTSTVTSPRYKALSRKNVFISTTRQPQKVKVFRKLLTPIPLASSSSESDESFQQFISTTNIPKIIKRIKMLRKRTTTTTAEPNVYSESTEY